MRVLGLIPARGGSKSIPRKNIRLLSGKPLLQYTTEAALAARRLDKVVLTTDDEEIAKLGGRLGVEVPFMRPAGLAADDTPTLPVVQHAVSALEAGGERFDAVCLLQPTSPARTPELIDACIELLETTKADSVVTVTPIPPEHNPHWAYFQADDGTLRISTGESEPIARRQDLPPAFCREGSVYVTWRDVLMVRGSLYGDRTVGYVVDARISINIDGQADWDRAERLLSESAI